jgi:AAA+ ATPase superfamily predicted ATPase
MGYQSYSEYGIEREWVEKLRKKAKDPLKKERLKELADGLTREDLADPDTVSSLVDRSLKILNEKTPERQKRQMVRFVLEQQIDPNNFMHLLRLWNMFR